MVPRVSTTMPLIRTRAVARLNTREFTAKQVNCNLNHVQYCFHVLIVRILPFLLLARMQFLNITIQMKTKTYSLIHKQKN